MAANILRGSEKSTVMKRRRTKASSRNVNYIVEDLAITSEDASVLRKLLLEIRSAPHYHCYYIILYYIFFVIPYIMKSD